MNSSIPAIELQNVHKSYGHVQALRGVDLEVRQGEVFGFLGPNGAGKTTTIRCLLDLIRPSGGKLSVLGLDPQARPVEVRRRCGYLPGELHLDESLTVAESLQLLNRLRSNVAEWKTIVRLAERLDLNLKLKLKNLSKGNKQKAGIVQALMHHPKLLLLDEPTSGLDPLVQQEVYQMLREARDEGATVFFSSHVLSEVQGISSRVGIIRRGKIIEVAETETLINRSYRHIRVTFKSPVAVEDLSSIPGAVVESAVDNQVVILRVEGEMDPLIKALAAYPIRDLDVEKPSLEEIFLAYYQNDGSED